MPVNAQAHPALSDRAHARALVVFCGGLALGDLALRSAPAWAALGLAVGLFAWLAPAWLARARREAWDWFRWTKLGLVVLSVVVCQLVRHEVVGVGWPVEALMTALLQGNIAVAVVRARSGSVASSVAGGILMLTTPWLSPTPDPMGLSVPVPLLWVAAYTVWNLSFVHQQRGGTITAMHGAVHASALLAAIAFGLDHWVLARAHTLGLALMYYIAHYPAAVTPESMRGNPLASPWLVGHAMPSALPWPALVLAVATVPAWLAS